MRNLISAAGGADDDVNVRRVGLPGLENQVVEGALRPAVHRRPGLVPWRGKVLVDQGDQPWHGAALRADGIAALGGPVAQVP